MKRTLITSALPYANGFIHLGHLAGAYLPADIYARYLRLNGTEVLYVCGSDEHGVAITIAADKEKVTPKEIIDKYHDANSKAFEDFAMSFDIYSRTSIQEHHATAREFFGKFLEKGYLKEREEEQYYDEKASMFLPDRYVEGICPNCGNEKARGDQCDSCGAYYNQLELKNPKSLVSGDTPIAKKTIHWYLRFDMFQQFLEEYIESKSSDWKENVLQQTRSWLKRGLAERAITRDISWGVKIDGIDGVDNEKAVGKVLYVWFDAVLGYITATKIWSREHNQDWMKWWKDKETRYIAFIGKDNIVFHTLIFPALLYGRDDNYVLPENVPANEFLNLEGEKFSKSRNWSIDLRDFVNEFGNSNYIDTLRYTLAMNFPETKDSDFTWKDFQSRNNNELADIIGNFVNRTLHFISTKFDNKVPELSEKYDAFTNEWDKVLKFGEESEINRDLLSDNDINLIVGLQKCLSEVNKNYQKFRFRDALTETMNIARLSNKYFNDEEPWKTAKTDIEYCKKTLYVCCNLINTLGVIFSPILPNSSAKLFKALGLSEYTGKSGNDTLEDKWNNCLHLNLKGNSVITKPDLLFVKIDDETIQKQIDKLGDKTKTAIVDSEDKKNIVELITIDDFKKVQLRTAQVIEAENVPKSKKLLKLQLQIGEERRQIVAGIAEFYKPEQLLGKIIVVVFNLIPAKLMGIESNGMLLAANKDGRLRIITVENDDIGSNAEVR